MTAWTAGECTRFLAHVRNERLYALYRLAVTSGMRRGERLGLTWLALDLEGATLRVERQFAPRPGGADFGPPNRSAGTGRSRSTRRRSRRCASTATRSSWSGRSRATPTRTSTSCSATS